MAMTRIVSRALAMSLGAALAAIAACADVERRAIEPRAELDGDLAPPPGAAEQVEDLTALRAVYDEDGDGFVSPAEAEGYYRRYFAQLDDNNDGRLSRAELKPEVPSIPELEVASEELLGATEREYVDLNMRNYDLRADRTVGMMSTREFDEMVGDRDPALSMPRPGIYP